MNRISKGTEDQDQASDQKSELKPTDVKSSTYEQNQLFLEELSFKKHLSQQSNKRTPRKLFFHWFDD